MSELWFKTRDSDSRICALTVVPCCLLLQGGVHWGGPWFWLPSTGMMEKEMATHPSTLAWRIPWTEEPGRLQSMGSQRVRHDWVTSLITHSQEWTFLKCSFNMSSNNSFEDCPALWILRKVFSQLHVYLELLVFKLYIYLLTYFYLFTPGLSWVMWDLVPRPGIKPQPPALGIWSLSHWTTREVPIV